MKTRALGSSGLAVGAVGMGCMYLSIQDRPTEEAAVRTLLAAMDAGISLLDTADVYCHDQRDIGHNERLVARALRERKSAAVTVATKGGLERPNGAWTRNGRPGHLRRACEASLAALGVDRIDVYQLHAPDPSVPFADSVGELARLRAEGKIAHVGLSNVTVSEIEEARRIVPVVSVQNRWNPGDRAPETDGVLANLLGERDRISALFAVRRRERRTEALGREARGRGEAPRDVAPSPRARLDAGQEPGGHRDPGRATHREHHRQRRRGGRDAVRGGRERHLARVRSIRRNARSASGASVPP